MPYLVIMTLTKLHLNCTNNLYTMENNGGPIGKLVIYQKNLFLANLKKILWFNIKYYI